MQVESPKFTEEDVRGFVTDYFERERRLLIERLGKIADGVDGVVAGIGQPGSSDDSSWSPAETLAHMVTSSQFFGWLVYQVATKKDHGADLLEVIRMRDAGIASAAEQAPDVLAKQLRETVERTISFIQKVDYNDLRTPFDYLGIQMNAEDLVRIPLASHLESHLEQIRGSVG